MASNRDIRVCEMCGFLAPSLKQHISHLRLVHQSDKTFSAKCGIHSCTRMFTTFGGFNSHVYREHRRELGLNLEEEEVMNQEESNFDELSTADASPDPSTSNATVLLSTFGSELMTHTSGTESVATDVRGPDVTQSMAKFLLKLSEDHGVSEVALQSVIEGCQKSMNEMQLEIALTVERTLLQHGLEEQIELKNCVTDSFAELNTSYLRAKYIKQTFDYNYSKLIP